MNEGTKKCLVFHLAGPMESWGGVAVGTLRPTQRHPTKSSIVGIVSASLGLERTDNRMLSLFTDFEYAVISAGLESEMSDYSTVETSESEGGEYMSTLPPRSLELSRKKRNTMLVDKRYICNGYFTVLMVPVRDSEFSLDCIKKALEHPHFVPYLGRKSCPLSFPMNPTIEEYIHLKEIILQVYLRPFRNEMFPESRLLKDIRKLRIYSTYDIGDYEGHIESVTNDDLPDRSTWQFRERIEYEFMEGLD